MLLKMELTFFNDMVDGVAGFREYRSVYRSDIPVSGTELTLLQLLQLAEGTALWHGKFLYMTYLEDDMWYPGTPLRYYLTLSEQNVQGTDGKVFIMLRNNNPEDSDIYRGHGFAPLP